MKKAFYTALLLITTATISKACFREPTLFERILDAETIVKVGYQLLDSTKTDGRTTYTYGISEKKNFKGVLKTNKVTLYGWQRPYSANKSTILFLNYDSLGYAEYSYSYSANQKESPYFIGLYKPTEETLLKLCYGMKNLTECKTPEDYITVVSAGFSAFNEINYETLSSQLSSFRWAGWSRFDNDKDWSLLSQKDIEIAKDYLKNQYLKPGLLLEIGYKLQFKEYNQILISHLNDYYCQQANDNYKHFSGYYAGKVETYLIKNSRLKEHKYATASFIRKRNEVSAANYTIGFEAAFIDSLFPGINLTSDINSLSSENGDYTYKAEIRKQIHTKLITYRPSQNEPKFRTTFCTSEPAGIPKLQFDFAPNPTEGAFAVTFKQVNPEEPIFIQIIGISGEVVYNKSIIPYAQNFIRELSINELEAGMYHIRIFNKYSVDTKVIQKF
ncbi:MAG: T9SS type A sorting domain-containing protein [Bacteroidia bacterium]